MGNKKSIILFGGRNKTYSNKNNGTDFYPTPHWATQLLLDELKKRKIQIMSPILEPCNGLGNITKVLEKNFLMNITTFDINKKAIADKYRDFLKYEPVTIFKTIITNPPFKGNYNCEFIKKALEILPRYGKAIFLLKLVFIESKKRKEFFNKFPPKLILVHSTRLNFYGGTGVCYAWFIWEKGYKGKTTIEVI